MTLARLKSIAGVTIPDTELCNAAVDLLEASSPEFLCTHCLRTYIFGSLAVRFGSLAVRGIGRSVVDEEAAFCGAVLHDLGLVPAYLGRNRFEVDGADAAREFCSKHQVSPERADLVWEAIALHTSVGIASRMAAEIALVHLITTLPKHSGHPAIPAARKATSTMTIPNSLEVNEVPDANRIQSNCSQ
jgi:HD domain